MWAHVIVAWVFNFIIMYFLYTNYAAITTMRKNFFETPEYQASLHSRTLMVRSMFGWLLISETKLTIWY
jgi:hypothetical protein